MDPIWYTIRTIVSVVMAGIGGLLLWAAYLVSGNVTGAAIAWMVLLAVYRAALQSGIHPAGPTKPWRSGDGFACLAPMSVEVAAGRPRRGSTAWRRTAA